MSGQLRMLDCEFCAPPVTDPASPLRLVANRTVAACGEVLLVADHAPMTLGHLLLLPREHHTGMASFVAGRPDRFPGLRSLTRRYREAFGGCTVIEHGTGVAASSAGACIDHAHWHLLPYSGELASIVDGDYGDSMKRVGSMAEFARDHAGTDYLLYWDDGGARVARLDTTARFPQYARSVVARYIEPSVMPHDWDWALRADDELLVRTLAVATTAFITGGEVAHDSIEQQGDQEIA